MVESIMCSLCRIFGDFVSIMCLFYGIWPSTELHNSGGRNLFSLTFDVRSCLIFNLIFWATSEKYVLLVSYISLKKSISVYVGNKLAKRVESK